MKLPALSRCPTYGSRQLQHITNRKFRNARVVRVRHQTASRENNGWLQYRLLEQRHQMKIRAGAIERDSLASDPIACRRETPRSGMVVDPSSAATSRSNMGERKLFITKRTAHLQEPSTTLG